MSLFKKKKEHWNVLLKPHVLQIFQTGTTWNSAYSSTGNSGTGNGYTNCYNNNCQRNNGLYTVPSAPAISGPGYGISGSGAIYNPYSSLPSTGYKSYPLPSANRAYLNLGPLPYFYTGGYSGLDYTLPNVYSSYGSYGIQGQPLENLLSLSSYQGSLKAAAADDASEFRKMQSSQSLTSS